MRFRFRSSKTRFLSLVMGLLLIAGSALGPWAIEAAADSESQANVSVSTTPSEIVKGSSFKINSSISELEEEASNLNLTASYSIYDSNNNNLAKDVSMNVSKGVGKTASAESPDIATGDTTLIEAVGEYKVKVTWIFENDSSVVSSAAFSGKYTKDKEIKIEIKDASSAPGTYSITLFDEAKTNGSKIDDANDKIVFSGYMNNLSAGKDIVATFTGANNGKIIKYTSKASDVSGKEGQYTIDINKQANMPNDTYNLTSLTVDGQEVKGTGHTYNFVVDIDGNDSDVTILKDVDASIIGAVSGYLAPQNYYTFKVVYSGNESGFGVTSASYKLTGATGASVTIPMNADPTDASGKTYVGTFQAPAASSSSYTITYTVKTTSETQTATKTFMSGTAPTNPVPTIGQVTVTGLTNGQIRPNTQMTVSVPVTANGTKIDKVFAIIGNASPVRLSTVAGGSGIYSGTLTSPATVSQYSIAIEVNYNGDANGEHGESVTEEGKYHFGVTTTTPSSTSPSVVGIDVEAQGSANINSLRSGDTILGTVRLNNYNGVGVVRSYFINGASRITLVMRPSATAGTFTGTYTIPASGITTGSYSYDHSDIFDNSASNQILLATDMGVFPGIAFRVASISHTTHTYSTTWSYDTNSHWHACTGCNDSTAVADLSAHVFPMNYTVERPATETTTGTQYRLCTVCGYRQTSTIPATGANSNLSNTVISAINSQTGTSPARVAYPSGGVLTSQVFDVLRSNPTKSIQIYPQTGTGVTWTFYGIDITGASKQIDLNVSIASLDATASGNRALISNLVGGRPTVVCSFANNGTLPGRASVRIPLTASMIQSIGRSGISAYYVNTTSGQLETIANNLAVAPEPNNYVEFTITHNSDIILAGQAAGANTNTNTNSSTTVDPYADASGTTINPANPGGTGTTINPGTQSTGTPSTNKVVTTYVNRFKSPKTSDPIIRMLFIAMMITGILMVVVAVVVKPEDEVRKRVRK